MEKILITGISGYIGLYLALFLQGKKFSISGLDKEDLPAELAENKNIIFEKVDLRDKEHTIDFFRRIKPDVVIHFAASIEVGESEEKPLEYYENNVTGTIHVLEAMKATGVPSLIFASTAAVYGINSNEDLLTEDSPLTPESVYGRTKLMCEQIIKDAKLKNVMIFRFFNVMGGPSVERRCVHLFPIILRSLKNHEPIHIFGNDFPTPDSTCIRDYISLEDLAEAHLLTLDYFDRLDHENYEVINLGTSHGYSVLNIVHAFFKESGRIVPLKIVDRRKGDPPILVASNRKARFVLGWSPKQTIVESIRLLCAKEFFSNLDIKIK